MLEGILGISLSFVMKVSLGNRQNYNLRSQIFFFIESHICFFLFSPSLFQDRACEDNAHKSKGD